MMPRDLSISYSEIAARDALDGADRARAKAEIARLTAALKIARSYIKDHPLEAALVMVGDKPESEWITLGATLDAALGSEQSTDSKQDLSELSNEELFRRAYPNGVGDVNSGRS